MHVGIDLAWNNRARTGLAVVDRSGVLVSSRIAVADEEIDAWLARLRGSLVNVAIDAPLIVTNLTGMRECERLVGRSYGRFDASCHASNLGVSYLNPPRAATLAQRHGWDTDPAHIGSASAPSAMEVYPHAAIVGLFRLGRILKYKHGSLVTRQPAFTELLDRMEGIDVLALRGNARWQEIRQAAVDATRPVELDRIEDEVDAILCAHLAWQWHRDPGSLHVFGDAGSGYIIAPPPPTHPPSPRAASAPARVPGGVATQRPPSSSDVGAGAPTDVPPVL